MDNLVSTDWLAERLGSADLAVVDASRHLPAAGRDAMAEFEAEHIPGARYLALDTFTDPTSQTPSALPNAIQVAQRLAELGISSDARIVLYDDSAVKTSARAWFALKAHGLANVAILDGGLAKWRREGRALETGKVAIAPVAAGDLPAAQGIATKTDILANCDSGAHQVIDARGSDRVFGSGIDPVHGGQNGRIPGALNLPFGKVFADDGVFKSPAELRAAFTASGIDFDRPVITTCGSGVTASVLLFALHLAGKTDVQLYDGSWQEWEADPATPKEQGPA